MGRPNEELMDPQQLETLDRLDDPKAKGRGRFRTLWRKGRRKSATVVEGVRAANSISIRGGGSSPLGQIDLLARSFALFLGWLVSLQAATTGIFSHRDSLFEVCLFCVS
jgi:hypothetical protein